jgi:hypothetical protein
MGFFAVGERAEGVAVGDRLTRHPNATKNVFRVRGRAGVLLLDRRWIEHRAQKALARLQTLLLSSLGLECPA